jgi:hypothetical protein
MRRSFTVEGAEPVVTVIEALSDKVPAWRARHIHLDPRVIERENNTGITVGGSHKPGLASSPIRGQPKLPFGPADPQQEPGGGRRHLRPPAGDVGYSVGAGADGSFCQMPKSFPSVSLQIANQPMPGTGRGSSASPPSSFTRAAPALISSTSK